ncbi:MAG: hypothetical protein K2X81_24535 [Candidatus Obscuribacterales bacterium]|nr:hypothetical protein [Candidatus Obscuribacterales bacterium]
MSEAELIHQIIMGFVQLGIVFGIPLVVLVVFVNKKTKGPSETETRKKAQEEQDKAYLAAHGAEAFAEMLRNRKLHKPGFFDKIASGPNSGVLYSTLTPKALAHNIEHNQQAFSGTPPVCWEHFWPANLNFEIFFKGEWPNPTDETITTTLTLTIILAAQADGRTAVKYSYKAEPAIDPFAQQLIEISNMTLNNICNFK